MFNHNDDLMKAKQQEQAKIYVTGRKSVNRKMDWLEMQVPPEFKSLLTAKHDRDIRIADWQNAKQYLEILKLKINKKLYYYHKTKTKIAQKELIEALHNCRDYAIWCLELEGKEMNQGKETIDPALESIVGMFFVLQKDHLFKQERITQDKKMDKSDVQLRGENLLSKIDLFDEDDPLGFKSFRKSVVRDICQLATIPSGQTLLKTVFDLRFCGDIVLDENGDFAKKHNAAIEILNPYSKGTSIQAPAAGPSATGMANLTRTAIEKGSSQTKPYVIAPMVECESLIQNALFTLKKRKRSEKRFFQNIEPIMLGHEIIHSIHRAYGVITSGVTTAGSNLEEDVTSGVKTKPMGEMVLDLKEEELADKQAYNLASEKVKLAFAVSERSLREDFGAVSRYSYKNMFSYAEKQTGPKQEEKMIYTFMQWLIARVANTSIVNNPIMVRIKEAVDGKDIFSLKSADTLNPIICDKNLLDEVIDGTVNVMLSKGDIDENQKKQLMKLLAKSDMKEQVLNAISVTTRNAFRRYIIYKLSD